MLAKLQMIAAEGTLKITHVYVAHLKTVDETKTLMHVEATSYEDAMPHLRNLFEQHLYQAIEGQLNDTNFHCWHTGEVSSVAKVASDSYDRTMNRPGVEVLEAIGQIKSVTPEQLIETGNILAYKVMAAGSIKNHLLGIVRFEVIPVMGAEPKTFTFASLADLEDKEEVNFDSNQGVFVTRELHNVVKRANVSRAAFFPSLDDNLDKTIADITVFAKSSATAWFKALDATQRFSTRREGMALLKNMAQTTGPEIPHSLIFTLATELLPHANDGIPAMAFVEALEKGLGHGIDRLAVVAKWESDFKNGNYRPSYAALFHGAGVEKPTKLMLKGEEVQITIQPRHLNDMRTVDVNGEFFTVMRLPLTAKINLGKDLNIAIATIDQDELVTWMNTPPAPAKGNDDGAEEQA